LLAKTQAYFLIKKFSFENLSSLNSENKARKFSRTMMILKSQDKSIITCGYET